jgi:signal transduction histidine kinase
VLVVVFTRWRRASDAQRRTLAPGVWGGAAIVLTIIAERGVIFFGAPPALGVGLRWSAQVVLVVWPLALLLGLLRSHLDRSAVSRMIVELGAGMPPGDRLRIVLARALHDPSLELAYWLPERQAFVDAEGTTVDLPSTDGRAVTYLERDGDRIAVLVHDAALAAEPELVEAVAAGAGLAVDNERLQAEVRAQLQEVRASRARIVEAAYSARREVERNLHDGAQQRLLSVALALHLARSLLGDDAEGEGKRQRAGGRGAEDEVGKVLEDASDELAGALDELRELARGIYPVLLTDSGLGPALQSLADRSPVPAVLTSVPSGRLPGAVEQTCYFVVSEALTNATKHAAASEVSIVVQEHGGLVAVEIADDGVGGADPSGSGLRGLTDRVAALGGRLEVDSPRDGGTRVIAELPCG